ncbi:hypothetical protein P154DRAFT_521731 [Amniculicola lignicola CBS 123094]|uniref:Zn(2)-C6 fungal-type domain-containing protein n=1 Tax=Amniculicola lignicola CBS 123094 TaxID=1392246 RepID=A0A6A5WI29_9PLEO|nr:hypothetical protein P154DRAFT_521731 [Amniculicola lignicola CBS 123094]
MDRREESQESDRPLKRRKIRKGTHSCWDCKRRKVKCSFASEDDKICVPCRRRGAKCVAPEVFVDNPGMEEQENDEPPRRGTEEPDLGNRMEKLEAMLKKLSEYTTLKGDWGLGTDDRTTSKDATFLAFPTPAQSEPTPSVFDHISPTVSVIGTDKLQRLSQHLLDAFPSQGDCKLICDMINKTTDLFFLMNTTPRHKLDNDCVAWGIAPPNVNTHPIILAKKMLMIAMCVQHLIPELLPLSESPDAIMFRMANTAADAIATNDELLGSVECLECIILETLFKANCGNVRQAWLACRRALATATLMGLNRRKIPRLTSLDPTTNIDPHFTWFRLAYLDRYLSLLLGLPQANTATVIPTDPTKGKETTTARFERMEVDIAGRILERNNGDPSLDDYSLTEAIDAELLDATRELPATFWLPINFTNLREGSPEVFWEMMRLSDQLFHYFLLVHLHLPYLLRDTLSSSSPSATRTDATIEQIVYSKLACVNASREILTRFVAFRSWNRVPACCRMTDFVALLASLALLLAHLSSHQRKNGSLLAHQRLGDRAMMRQVLSNMECVAAHNNDALSKESAHLLKRLLDVEEEVSVGNVHNANAHTAHGRNDSAGGTDHVLEIPIPYFGKLRIANGTIIKLGESSPSPPSSQRRTIEEPDIPALDMGSIHFANNSMFLELSRPVVQTHYGYDLTTPMSTASHADSIPQSIHGPGLAVGQGDWAFQGVDTAFFDSLMRGSLTESGLPTEEEQVEVCPFSQGGSFF